jgi:hypothetical protein
MKIQIAVDINEQNTLLTYLIHLFKTFKLLLMSDLLTFPILSYLEAVVTRDTKEYGSGSDTGSNKLCGSLMLGFRIRTQYRFTV